MSANAAIATNTGDVEPCGTESRLRRPTAAKGELLSEDRRADGDVRIFVTSVEHGDDPRRAKSV